jgi:hypothetical protein
MNILACFKVDNGIDLLAQIGTYSLDLLRRRGLMGLGRPKSSRVKIERIRLGNESPRKMNCGDLNALQWSTGQAWTRG